MLLEEELQAFNWNELDQYPSFESCEDGIDFQANKVCFETLLTSHIFEVLKSNESMITQSLKDTLILDLSVSKRGVLSIKSLKGSHLSAQTTVRFKDTLTKSFSTLPVLYPAIKRSQHVQAVFQLPIILNAY
jgi:hypothetical protein|tara:strand:- start:1283 stop:1678 length:396 start_codon:yes stop_codon:yes gene_type:complete